MAAPRPFVPRPPQWEEAQDLLAQLQEIEQFLRSTAPQSPQLRPLSLQIQKLSLKLKQVQQRINLYGFSEPVLPASPQAPRVDSRSPDQIGVLTAELGLQAQGERLSSGPEVAVLRELLCFCGIGLESGDQFDQATLTALRLFQKQQSLPVSGRVDDKTRPRLNQLLRLLRLGQQSLKQCEQALAYWQTQVGESLPEHTRQKLKQVLWQRVRLLLQGVPCSAEQWESQPALSPAPEDADTSVLVSRLGTGGQAGLISRGPEVSALQGLLQRRGYALVANGQFDLQTFSALKTFQQDHGLLPSGETDLPTLALLNRLLAREASVRTLWQAWSQAQHDLQTAFQVTLPVSAQQEAHDLQQQLEYLWAHPEAARWPGWGSPQLFTQELGPLPRLATGPEVLLLQELLQQLDAPSAPQLSLSGIFDSSTQQHLRRFQSERKLPPSGWLDRATRQALNDELLRLRHTPKA
ncbi:MAG: peptidoglycan-binding protein [Candidatus Sericytochromatia bacterium]